MTIGQTGARPVLAYVVHALNPGGTERLVVDMSCAFSNAYDVHVFCLDEPGVWADELRSAGVAVHGLWRQPGLDWRLAWDLARRFRYHGVQVIHAHQCPAWFYAGLACWFYREAPLLFEEHGRFYPESDRVLRRLFNRLLLIPRTARIVAVSADIGKRLTRYEGVCAERIDVVYNGTAAATALSSDEREALRRECGIGSSDFVVGTVGRLDPIKNLPMLVASLAQVARQEPRVVGMVIGDGAGRDDLEALVRRYGLTDRVRVLGYRSDARRLTSCLDLFVLTSWSEGTSMALLEAMSSGVPVAVTAVGGNPELVIAGETGWIVAAGEVDALTAAILDAVRNEERRQAFSRAGHSRFERQFRFDRMIAQYAQIYHDLRTEPRSTVRDSI